MKKNNQGKVEHKMHLCLQQKLFHISASLPIVAQSLALFQWSSATQVDYHNGMKHPHVATK